MKTIVKTAHFRYRQWDRGVDETIISLVKPFIQRYKNKDKMELIITPPFLNRMGFKVTRCLILIIKRKICITCYWKEFSECLFGKTKFSNPQIFS